MSKRYAVLGLSVVLALALAVPALGGPSNPVASMSASVKKIANKALKTAKAAQTTANTALSTANSAQTSAKSAADDAKKAQTTANSAQASANSAKATADSAKATAESAKNSATAASAAAAAAEANANTRIKDSHEVIGTASASDTVTSKSSSANCESTEPVLGGGFFVGGEANDVTVTSSDAQIYGHGWFAAGRAIGGGTPTWSITAVVMCGTK
jgi:multidrug efflux pump subunit AcrA (membrane-fusion protein)